MFTAFKPAAAYLLCQGAGEVWWQMSAVQPSRWQDPFHPDRQPVCGTYRQTAPAPCLGKDRSSAADPTPHADHLSPPLSAQKGSAHLAFLSILISFSIFLPLQSNRLDMTGEEGWRLWWCSVFWPHIQNKEFHCKFMDSEHPLGPRVMITFANYRQAEPDPHLYWTPN